MSDIDTDIPLPVKKVKFPWKSLAVGHSFFRECPLDKVKSMQCRVGAPNLNLYPKHFISRPAEGGVRYWRSADIVE